MKILGEAARKTGLGVGQIIYHSLESVIKGLTASKVGSTPQVKNLIQIGAREGILDGSGNPLKRPVEILKSKKPFIVVEGLDGSGKTKVSTALFHSLNVKLMRTPPDEIREFKPFFDAQPEPIRRAYYSFGNYLAANAVGRLRESSELDGFVMDRYWPSTACYAATHEETFNSGQNLSPSDLIWPPDLLQPNLVIFLIVSEAVRRQRHATRNTTNTQEEILLAENAEFRKNLIANYGKIQGPPFFPLNAEDEIEIVAVKVYKKVTQSFKQIIRDEP